VDVLGIEWTANACLYSADSSGSFGTCLFLQSPFDRVVTLRGDCGRGADGVADGNVEGLVWGPGVGSELSATATDVDVEVDVADTDVILRFYWTRGTDGQRTVVMKRCSD